MKHLFRKSSESAPLVETTCGDAELGPAQIIDELMASSLMLTEDWDALPLQVQEKILWCADRASLLRLLVEYGLLTQYQCARISAGTTFGLLLGSYRVLDRIGAGGMAVVFKAEHIDLRHLVAIKVLPVTPNQDSRLEHRFFAETRVVSRLHHPNIVAATDAGKLVSSEPNTPSLRYLVMEYVTGKDLEEHVQETGPLPIARACNFIYQIASALSETHKFNLVHRDLKPSNIMITAEDQAKLLDFGLSRHFDHRLTSPGTVLGTLDYMSPEQAKDASAVDIRADIYSLGGTLYWTLTGKLPFPSQGNPIETLTKRLQQEPPSIREILPECPVELDQVIKKMMAREMNDRYPTPQAVMQALLPFLRADNREHFSHHSSHHFVALSASNHAVQSTTTNDRILIVDDEAGIRAFCRQILTAQGFVCDEVSDGAIGIDLISRDAYDLVLLDVNLPDMCGADVLGRMREVSTNQNMKIMMLSGHTNPDEMAEMLLKGADDYLSKPFSVVQFVGRVKAALRLKAAQDRSIILNQQLLALNAELETNLRCRDADLADTRNSLVLALTKLVEQRDSNSTNHINRMQRYARVLAESAARSPAFADEITNHFIEMLECCVPMHDIGKVSLPDHLLMKSGTLTIEEQLLMQTHTIVAAESLQDVAKHHRGAVAFLQMAIDITRHHHERFDGTGYPDRLTGAAIPLSARLVSICDVYDALRSRRAYKPALSHPSAVQIITESSPGQFDPALVQVFAQVHSQFEAIYKEMPD